MPNNSGLKEKTKVINCSCGSKSFRIFPNKLEQVAVVECKNCNKHHFLLDSEDYWQEIIQEKYPGKTKCSKCKEDKFEIELNYLYREDKKEDIKRVNVITTCINCRNERKLMKVDIDYGPTDKLYNAPLKSCENPRLKPLILTKNCYWEKSDFVKLLKFLVEELGLRLFCYKKWNQDFSYKEVKIEEAKNIALNERYYRFIASLTKPDVSSREGKPDWISNELIFLGVPMSIAGLNGSQLLFHIYYSGEYINKGLINKKSISFEQVVNKIDNWIKDNYHNIRGKNCYDNLKVHILQYGDYYLNKKND